MNDEASPQYGGGFFGFFKGTQSLAAAFWLVGVAPAVVILLVTLVLSRATDLPFLQVFIIEVALVAVTRLVAWTAIIRCIGNTQSTVWSVLAGIVVAADILHKAVIWSVLWVGYQFNASEGARAVEAVELCQLQLSEESGQVVSEISVQNYRNFPADEEPYYLTYYIDRSGELPFAREFKCRIVDGAATIEPKDD